MSEGLNPFWDTLNRWHNRESGDRLRKHMLWRDMIETYWHARNHPEDFTMQETINAA